ncbi:tetratricopeptide repeat protein [Micromonospora zamorensis]|uniref:tetratricopeptide repeat protein n=1 Tax=Micromonospora zamorensis TaxID=709883 RepID=UPI002E1D4994
MVVDYADRWPVSHLQSLLTHLKSMSLQTGLTVRVLLLARSTTAWWPALRNRLRSDHQVEATAQPLPPLGEQVDRGVLYRQARDRFAAAMDITGTDQLSPPPNLADDAFLQVLSVHMAALVAVDAHRRDTVVPTHRHALSSYLLERERDHWYTLHNRPVEPRKTSPEVMGRAVYLATLTAAVPRATATHLLQRVGLTEPGATTIIDDHRFCYPPDDPRTVLQALHPDRLGEDLIALSTPGHPHTNDEDGWGSDDWTVTVAEQLLQSGPDLPPWTANAVTVLVETARRWDHVATEVLYPLLHRHPQLALAAGGTTITRLATIPSVDPDILAAINTVLPTDRHADLDIATAAISTTLTPHQLATTADPAEHARLHETHALRLANAGLHDQALAASQEAVTIRRQLMQSDPVAYLPDLAMSLANLGVRLSALGRREEALVPAEEAVDLYRQLAKANPTYPPKLAASLNNLGIWVSALGRREEALVPAEEAVDLYRQLAKANPAYVPDFAMSLSNLGVWLSALGREEEALVPAEEAVDLYRQLAKANPTYLPNFAGSLTNLGARLSKLGRREEALAPFQEAVDLDRQSAKVNPAAYLPDLAGALDNLGICLSALGREDEALTHSQEAVDLYRQLAKASPAAYLPDLARSLTNLGVRLSELGQPEHALTPFQEAVTIRRPLAQADSVTYLPDLAASLNNLGICLSALGREDDALVPSQKAADLYRQLAKADPSAYLPDLAMSLTNLGVRLSELGRREQALASSQKATDLYRQLAKANPAYIPNLAISLWSYAWICVRIQENLPHALVAVTETIDLYTKLAEQLPQAFDGRLRSAFLTLAEVLDGLGRTEDAAELRRQLAVAVK